MQPILHHYWRSPYAEKVRAYLGYKGLAWRSREIAVTPPRPSLAPILGAFRRTPVLQIGADYVCDTRLILEAIDTLSDRSTPTAPATAVSDLICGWGEPRMFVLLGAIRFQKATDIEGVFDGQVDVERFSTDRLPFMQPAYEAARFRQLREPAIDHLRRYLSVIDKALAERGPFIGGDRPSHGDFSAYHTIWWLRVPPRHDELVQLYPRIEKWADRFAAFGKSSFVSILDDETFEAARLPPAFQPDWPIVDDDRLGHEVEIVPDDYGRNPIRGRLIVATDRHVAIERAIDGLDKVRVHIPRLGYEIVAV